MTSSRSELTEPGWQNALAEEDDAELTYENIRLAQTGEVKQGQGAEQSKEPRWNTRYLPLGLLGACLFLLATTIGLGVRSQTLLGPVSALGGFPALLAKGLYGPGSRCLSPADWQVSQHLQQASRAHEAESSRLSQQVSTKGATLEQTARELEQARRELEQARRELEQMWLKENSTQEQLRLLEAALEGSKEELARVQEEKTEIKEKLNQTENALSSIRPCEQTDCCPADWVLYRGKCLFVSKEKKSWQKSKEDCELNSAHLLITKSWDWQTMPNFLKNTDVQYWIGFRKDGNKEPQWVDESPFKP
nr:B-cell differentiation antigen CD72 [Chrysemys picta bellii]